LPKSIWFSPRAIGLHVVIIVIVPAFAALCTWQVYRALGGNDLSWAYVFEWPFFAGYAIYMWWRLLHEAPDGTATAPVMAGAAPEAVENEDVVSDRAAYNDYLTALAARGKRKQWR
jgi:hypothetical protein